MQAHRRLDLVRYVGSRADTYDPKYGELAIQELGLTTAVEQSSPGGVRSEDDDAERELEIDPRRPIV